jgi:Fur family transcriptional regulator, ferric uptake regulator
MAKKAVRQRRTSQRDTIARVIRAARGPLTIVQIHERAQRGSHGLGVATVYRTVKLLLASQQIHVLRMPDGEKRYESADLDHHHHFRCRRCEQVYDLPGCPLAIADGTKLPEGFEVDGHEVTLFGVCPSCREVKRGGRRGG